MSHLNVLPTLLNDLSLLEQALKEEGFQVQAPGLITDFDGGIQICDLVVNDNGKPFLAWNSSDGGRIELIVDLVRLTKQRDTSQLLHRINRRYTALVALKSAKLKFQNFSLSM
ncbi:hypothetical protein [Prochlorococcus sp. MIT 1300]|uniref:hypothetical protein n=1 Tax=Prochlorococcus sp. MIT 1300 TaxID=3096218 RepID=UPI002A76109D|nr:hypothetical protein [Prochlorococcus sp. MIT 1300]